MANRTNLVNLDAMIKRADFAVQESENNNFDSVAGLALRDLAKGGFIGPSLRKPDFQRETNHWSPEQIVSLLECFRNGDLIPSVILWRSTSYLFVIDGCHRLSVLRAWLEDDYGDGQISKNFFGDIPQQQLQIAQKTRKLINEGIGTWQHFQSKIEDPDNLGEDRKLINALIIRSLPIQWVNGDADKAEISFFNINRQGTPLDETEEILLKNRKKPISIAARSVIRAGKGHKYWSRFVSENAEKIERLATELHQALFQPEVQTPVKTLDLPLGGSQGIRTALRILMDFMLIANRNYQGEPKKIDNQQDDQDGTSTIQVLDKSLKLAKRITGNSLGSLGLHPAVYFYGETGKHSDPLFMGIVILLGKHLSNNNKGFFKKFTNCLAKLESILIDNKSLITSIIQNYSSNQRANKYSELLDKIIDLLDRNEIVDENKLIDLSGLKVKTILSRAGKESKNFSDGVKSEVFIKTALSCSIKCPICDGYLDTKKSVSYDHITRKREGGLGDSSNGQLTHPYCNQAIKQ